MHVLHKTNQTVHADRELASSIFLLCNPGMIVGTRVGAKVFWHGAWDRARLSDKITCVKCKKILEKNA